MLKTTLKALAISLISSGIAAGPDDYERVYWDKKDARKIINKASYLDGGAFGETLLGTLTGRTVKTYGLWLTDDVCWAIAIIVQEEERRTDEEKEGFYKDCRAFAEDYYSIYVSASIFHVSTSIPVGVVGVRTIPDSIDESNPGRIFLQRRKDKSKFVRPVRLDTPPDYFQYLRGWSLAFMTDLDVDVDRDVLIRFPRDESLLEGQKDIDVELRQGGNRQRLKFSLKKLRANKGRLANL